MLHVLHTCCVVETLARGVAPAPFRYPAVNCGTQRPRQDALEAAVQADQRLRNRVAWMRGGGIGDEELRTRGLRYGWDSNSLRVEPLLDTASLDDLGQRLATGKHVQQL